LLFSNDYRASTTAIQNYELEADIMNFRKCIGMHFQKKCKQCLKKEQIFLINVEKDPLLLQKSESETAFEQLLFPNFHTSLKL